MRVLLQTGYHLWRYMPIPEQRLCRDQWKGSWRWWRMTGSIAEGFPVIFCAPIAI